MFQKYGGLAECHFIFSEKELIDFENSRIDDEINYTQCCTHAQQYGLLLFAEAFLFQE